MIGAGHDVNEEQHQSGRDDEQADSCDDDGLFPHAYELLAFDDGPRLHDGCHYTGQILVRQCDILVNQ